MYHVLSLFVWILFFWFLGQKLNFLFQNLALLSFWTSIITKWSISQICYRAPKTPNKSYINQLKLTYLSFCQLHLCAPNSLYLTHFLNSNPFTGSFPKNGPEPFCRRDRRASPASTCRFPRNCRLDCSRRCVNCYFALVVQLCSQFPEPSAHWDRFLQGRNFEESKAKRKKSLNK